MRAFSSRVGSVKLPIEKKKKGEKSFYNSYHHKNKLNLKNTTKIISVESLFVKVVWF